MRLGQPLALFALLLVPIVLAIHLWLEKERARRVGLAGDAALIDGLIQAGAGGGRGVRLAQAILLSIAIALCALALARPQFGMRTEQRKGRGIDLIVALDLSKSMLARDVVPSRLERARIELGALIDQLKGDRVGLVGFTSIALPLCPLTVDHAAFRLQLRSASPGDLPRGGTAITDAIESGKRMLESSKNIGAARALLVITDGEDNEGDAVQAAKKAHEAGIEVHVVGVGSRTGEPIPVIKPDGTIEGYLKDSSGQTVVSRLNESLLRQIADAGGGQVALPSAQGGIDLGSIRSHLATLKRAELQDRTIRIYEERYQWVLAPACVLLLLATVIRPSRRRVRLTVRGLAGKAAAAIALFALEGSAGAQALKREDPDIKQGNEELAAGRAKEAVEDYGRALSRLGEDPRILFNRGLAETKEGELDKAISDFKAAMENADSPSLRGESAFALGNAYRKLKKWDDAITAYKRALLEDPRQSGAARNLEIAQRLKLIESLQPKDPNKKNDGDKNKPPPPSTDGGPQPDGGDRDGGGEPDSGSGGPDGGGSPDGGGQNEGQDSGGRGAPDSGSSGGQSPDAGTAGDGGAQPQPEEEHKAEPSKEDETQQEANQVLDALQDQEKALKRKRLFEKYKGKQVEKDW